MSRAVTAFVIEDDGSVTFCAADGSQVTLAAGGGSAPFTDWIVVKPTGNIVLNAQATVNLAFADAAVDSQKGTDLSLAADGDGNAVVVSAAGGSFGCALFSKVALTAYVSCTAAPPGGSLIETVTPLLADGLVTFIEEGQPVIDLPAAGQVVDIFGQFMNNGGAGDVTTLSSTSWRIWKIAGLA